jgi:hypothetical protein
VDVLVSARNRPPRYLGGYHFSDTLSGGRCVKGSRGRHRWQRENLIERAIEEFHRYLDSGDTVLMGKIDGFLGMLKVESLVRIGSPITQSTKVKARARVLQENFHALTLFAFCSYLSNGSVRCNTSRCPRHSKPNRVWFCTDRSARWFPGFGAYSFFGSSGTAVGGVSSFLDSEAPGGSAAAPFSSFFGSSFFSTISCERSFSRESTVQLETR